MKFKMYLRKEEKDDIIAIACLQGLLEQRLINWEKYRSEEKELLKNARLAKTYTHKTLNILFTQLSPEAHEAIKQYSKVKQIMVLEKNDADIVRKREKEDDKFVKISAEDFQIWRDIIKETQCSTCIGTAEHCFYKHIFQTYGNLEDEEFVYYPEDKCPFAE